VVAERPIAVGLAEGAPRALAVIAARRAGVGAARFGFRGMELVVLGGLAERVPVDGDVSGGPGAQIIEQLALRDERAKIGDRAGLPGGIARAVRRIGWVAWRRRADDAQPLAGRLRVRRRQEDARLVAADRILPLLAGIEA